MSSMKMKGSCSCPAALTLSQPPLCRKPASAPASYPAPPSQLLSLPNPISACSRNLRWQKLQEDQAWPKKCGHMQGKKVIPAEEHAAKIASARDAIGDSDFFLVARTDARSTSVEYGLSEAISRANLYLEAGADAIFVAGPRSDDDLMEIGSKINGLKACTMLEGGVTPLHTPEELKAMGFHLIVYPFTSIYASARAMLDALKTLKENGTTRDHLDKVTSFQEFNQLLGLESCLELEKKYSSFKNQ